MKQTPKHILVADDHILVRGGLELICQAHFPEYKVHFASNLAEILKEFNHVSHFDLLILDLNFENDNGLLFIDKIFDKQSNISILIYTGINKPLLTNQLKKLGVKGFLNKASEEKEIIDAIKQTLNGGTYFENNTTSNLLFKKLSAQEIKVMNLYLQGFGNIEISSKLNINSSTISTYKKRIFEKLNVKNLTELIRLYNLYFNPNDSLYI